MLFSKKTSWRPKNFLLVFAGVLFFDQLLKRIFLGSGDYLENSGGLFGLGTDPTLSFLALLLFLGLVLSGLHGRREIARFSLPLALLLGGIASNLIDRLLRGSILDYLKIGEICAFNLADLAIAAGAALFIWRIMKE